MTVPLILMKFSFRCQIAIASVSVMTILRFHHSQVGQRVAQTKVG